MSLLTAVFGWIQGRLGRDFSRFADLIFLFHHSTALPALVVAFLALVRRFAFSATHSGENDTRSRPTVLSAFQSQESAPLLALYARTTGRLYLKATP